ncbi:tRNA-splicing ligase RtcB [Candidatus Tiddalikarchaeum anstoanum]|nr:tRNA-splicing ligase RtcB [Candidatus Tiddalikarchaeum anstoanum]
MKLRQLTELEWEIEKEPPMLVPGRVFASKPLLKIIQEDESLKQLNNMAQLPGIQKYAIALPDAHQGYGFCIGGVAALSTSEGGISPGGIGFDINCGVRVIKTKLKRKEVEPCIKELTNSLFTGVPKGIGKGSIINVPRNELKEVLARGSNWAKDKGFATDSDLRHTEDNGYLKNNNPDFVSDRAVNRGLPEVGSLGSGNHFLEIQFVEEIYNESVSKVFGLERDDVVVMVHCGSRGLGHQVASDYMRSIEDAYPDIVKNLPDRELAYAPGGSDLADKYFKAMNCAANFAWANRQLITYSVRNVFEKFFDHSRGALGMELLYDVCHNIAKIETYDGVECYVHRKGATRSFPKNHPDVPEDYKNVGQPVIIPGSMGTGCHILVGSEGALKKSFGSTAHGAGRLMSRTKAYKEFPAVKVNQIMQDKGIYLKSETKGTISEEAPGVYKDVDEVVRVSDQLDLAKKVCRLKPLGVIIG